MSEFSPCWLQAKGHRPCEGTHESPQGVFMGESLVVITETHRVVIATVDKIKSGLDYKIRLPNSS